MEDELFPELDEKYQVRLQKIFDTLADPELDEFIKGYIASKCWRGEASLKFGEWLMSRICEESVHEKSESYRQGYDDGFTAAGGDVEGLVCGQSFKARCRGLISYFAVGVFTNAIAYFALNLLIGSLNGERSPWWGMLWFALLLLFLIVNFFVWFKAVQWFTLGVDDARKTIKAAVGPTE